MVSLVGVAGVTREINPLSPLPLPVAAVPLLVPCDAVYV
jgi:hypothetical protein